tara:strand:- start:105 stop:575 length:471 start_codon:yes stop_codon:yes gene_type:complete
MKNNHNKNTGSDIERSDLRIDATGEVFTPLELCFNLVDRISENVLKNPNSTFLDPSAGNGNFIIALRDKLKEYHSEEHILNNMLYAIELMADNHAEMCNRLGVSVDHPHYVCADALEYDYSFGQPIGLENELGKIDAPKIYNRPTIDKKSQAAPLF